MDQTVLQSFVTAIDLDFGFRNVKLFQLLFDFSFSRLKFVQSLLESLWAIGLPRFGIMPSEPNDAILKV
jgi:hypothetical protein